MYKCFIVISTFLILFSCKRYDEGPDFTLRSAKGRLTNKWALDKYFENSGDKTADYEYYREEFTKDSCFIISKKVSAVEVKEKYKWEFEDQKNNIKLTNKGSTRIYYILRLESDAFWYWYQEGNTVKRVELRKE